MWKLAGFLLAISMMIPAQTRIGVQGHRGARAVLPENTIPAFEYAIQVGADALELDMAVTKDNVVVVSHDLTLHSPICKGPRENVPIRELTVAEVKQWDCGAIPNPSFPKQKAVPGTRMPTLDEVFSLAAKGTFDFNIETKMSSERPEWTPDPETYARLVLEVIRKHKLEKRVIVQSFDYRTLQATKKLAPEIRLAALNERPFRNMVDAAREAGAGIASPHYRLMNKESVKRAHDAGLLVIPWTANTPDAWEACIDAGVDAIITDDPGELIAYLKKKGLR